MKAIKFSFSFFVCFVITVKEETVKKWKEEHYRDASFSAFVHVQCDKKAFTTRQPTLILFSWNN